MSIRACCVGLLCVLCALGGERPATPARGPAVRLWCPNALLPVMREPAYADQGDTAPAVRLVGTRNGTFSGQAVVLSDAPVRLTGAVASELLIRSGANRIPASAVRVRYALATVPQKDRLKQYLGVKTLTQFDALANTPGEPGTVQPVWVTVSVPRDAAPGEYEGTLSIRPEGAAALVAPVRLQVANWVLPDPEEFIVHAGFIQSPDSVALQYQAPLWSDRHWDLIGRSFRHLAALGNKVVYIPLLCRTHFGNEETMVRWIAPKGALAADAPPTTRPATLPAATVFSHDFSIMEKYLDVCEQNAGRPQLVILYVWDYSVGGLWWGDATKNTGPKPSRVSLFDPSTGRVSMLDGPPLGTPECEAFYKPVMAGIHERLARRGYPDDAILLGIGGDKRPDKPTVAMFKSIAPYARWVSNSHSKILDFFGTSVGYVAHVWGVGVVVDPERQRRYGWQNRIPITVFPRYGGNKFVINPPLYADSPPAVQRMIWEGTTMAGLIGVGRCGADFWPVIEGRRKGERDPVFNRYPEASWGQLGVTNATADILYPGPDGALPTIRLELMREGIQEAEARIAIEKALLDPASRAHLGAERAARLQALLDDRCRAYLRAFSDLTTAYAGCQEFAAGPWPARSALLFSAAAEVALPSS
jgi:hypothetical protein